jgi:MoaA/NifB/PqqE/SkfB family radical SAM enzyme
MGRGYRMKVIREIPQLTFVNIYITWKCNYRCIHCWVEGDSEKSVLVDLERVLRFIKEAKEEGISSVRITGGEPLVYKKEVMKIIEFSHELGLECQMETNAYLFDDQFIDFLVENNVSCGVSLNGYNKDMNDNFTMKKGSFEKTVYNLKRALAKGAEINVITCVGKYNFNEFEKIVEYALDMGVSSVKLNPVTNCGRGSLLYERGLIFNELELKQFFEKYKSLREKYQYKITTMLPPSFDNLEDISKWGIYVCGGCNLLSYLPNNKIALCGYGGINDDITLCEFTDGVTVHDIWHNNEKLLDIRKSFYELTGVCNSCIHGKKCKSLCKVQGLSEYGSWNSPYPVCQSLYEEGLFPQSRLYKAVL